MVSREDLWLRDIGDSTVCLEPAFWIHAFYQCKLHAKLRSGFFVGGGGPALRQTLDRAKSKHCCF
jgi:hypothetical protein